MTVVQDDAPADGHADEEVEPAAADDTPAAAPGGADAQQQDEPPDDDDTPDEVDPASLTVAALREKLQKRGLSTAGKKAELVDRLTDELVRHELCAVSGCWPSLCYFLNATRPGLQRVMHSSLDCNRLPSRCCAGITHEGW